MSRKIVPQINSVVSGRALEYLNSAREIPSGTLTNIGFVYLLANPAMPGIYKVGCTERSPARRAAELSAGTACPAPFDVVCFWEGRDFQKFEAELHDVFSAERVNESREFFRGPLAWLVSCLDSWKDRRYGFYITEAGQAYMDREGA